MNYKSSWWLFFLFIGLAAVSWYLLRNKDDKTSLILADRDFAVKDISKIKKIFLATRDKDPVTLERKDGVWMVNDKYKAAPEIIKTLLQTLRDIRMQSIPSKGHVKSIMEGIAVYGIKVELYDDADELMKTFYIGGTTQQEYGTYFYMEHGTQPYIMEIPHFAGNLRERFDLEEIDWRDRTVFDLSVSTIEKLSVEYPHQTDQSFAIKKLENDYAVYEDNKTELKVNVTDQKEIKTYLQYFEEIGAEDIQNVHPMRKEISKIKPYCIISIKLIGKEDPVVYKFYPVNVDPSGKVNYEYNPELFAKEEFFRMHIDRSDGDFLLVQYPNVKPLFKTRAEFK